MYARERKEAHNVLIFDVSESKSPRSTIKPNDIKLSFTSDSENASLLGLFWAKMLNLYLVCETAESLE